MKLFQEAKSRIRDKFTFEYVSRLPQYKGLSIEKYHELINTLESLCFLGINYYLSLNKEI